MRYTQKIGTCEVSHKASAVLSNVMHLRSECRSCRVPRGHNRQIMSYWQIMHFDSQTYSTDLSRRAIKSSRMMIVFRSKARLSYTLAPLRTSVKLKKPANSICYVTKMLLKQHFSQMVTAITMWHLPGQVWLSDYCIGAICPCTAA